MGRRGLQNGFAVIGMAGLFPKAPDLLSYWQNILDKVDAVDEAPQNWLDSYYDNGPEDPDGTYTKMGGFLRELASFDPTEFGIMPGAVDGGIPDQFLALKIAREALLDAGYGDRSFDREKTGVIVGYGTYYNRGYFSAVQHGLVLDQTLTLLRRFCTDIDESTWADIREELKKSLPPITPEIVPALVPNILTGRIANRLNLQGPNFTIDAACASSLIAVDLAIRELSSNRCDMVIAGGVNVSSTPQTFMLFSKIGALSRSKIRPFCRTASGTLLGEGVGMVVIKRLADAEKAGDRIYAVIKSTGISSDGRGMGSLAPRLEGEVLAMQRAYSRIDPRSVGLIEAHGTGIPLGDQTEINALREVFGNRAGQTPHIALGSVKSMIGHCLPAAGIASFIKVALALFHKILPPTLHEQANRDLNIEETPFYINRNNRPWIHGNPDIPRRAGINAFGFGGINAHVVIEEYPRGNEQLPRTLHRDWPTELILLSAESSSGMINVINDVMQYLSSRPETRLADLAYTLSRMPAYAYRAAVVAKSIEELKEKMAFISDKADFDKPRQIYGHRGIFLGREKQEGEIAFLFPGENSQYVNMLGDLCLYFPSVRHHFDLLDEIFADDDIRPSVLLFPPENSMGQEVGDSVSKRLHDLDIGAMSVFTANNALNDLLTAFKIPCDVLLGHSSGENAALVISGTIRPKKETSLAKEMKKIAGLFQHLMRSDLIPKGVLLTVGGLKRSDVDGVIRKYEGRLTLIMDNCPNQLVIFGDGADVEDAAKHLRGLGGICVRLLFDRGYHSPHYLNALEDAPAFLEGFDLGKRHKRLYSCSTTKPFPDEPVEILRCIYGQWYTPVRFRETIERMYEDGVRTFIEVGPSSVLTSFVNDILQDRDHTALPSNHPRRSGLEQIQYLLGGLFVKHIPLDTSPLYGRLGLVECPIGSAEKIASRMRQPHGERKLELYGPVMRLAPDISRKALEQTKQRRNGVIDSGSPTCERSQRPAESPVEPAEDFRLEALKSHFDLMREFLANQARVMEQYTALNRSGTEEEEENQKRPSLRKYYPMLGKILYRNRESLKCERLFDLAHDAFLRDHSFGGHLSRYDNTLTGLSLIPFTVSAEIIAEAAHCLAAGTGVVVSLTNLRIYRWLALDFGQLLIRVNAERRATSDVGSPDGGGDFIHVCLFEVSASGDEFLSFEGDVRLAPKYSVPSIPSSITLTGQKPYRWSDADLYRKGMFHGPTFQAVKHIRRWGQEGIEADMEILPHTPFVGSRDDSFFQSDSILLDACGQLAVFWVFELFGLNHAFFPFQVRAIHLYSSPLTVGTRVVGEAKVVFPKEDELEAEMQVWDDKGKSIVRIEGWRDKRWIFPDSLHECRREPQASYFSEAWMTSETGSICRYIAPLSQPFFEETAGIGKKILAHIMLSRTELKFWYGIPERGPGRMEWLMGRTVAKDAVRQWAAEKLNLSLAPVDIEIQQTGAGKPFAVCPLVHHDIPDISISHSHGHAVAVLAEPGQSIGMDYQRMEKISAKELRVLAFGEQELAHLRDIDPPLRDGAIIALWSVKEAAAKAAGTGLGGRPEEWKIEYFSLKDGRASVLHNRELFSCKFWIRDEFAFSICRH